jgi:hypothetical protein
VTMDVERCRCPMCGLGHLRPMFRVQCLGGPSKVFGWVNFANIGLRRSYDAVRRPAKEKRS